jgi:hypothetical protein
VLLAVFSLLLGQHADAGLLNSPPPTFYGVPGQVIYRMGAIYYHPGQVNTVVTCTNLDDARAGVAIELFDQADNPTGTLAYADLAVGGIVTFVTSADWAEQSWVVVQHLTPLDSGKARVSATTTRLSCTGYHRIQAADGSMQNTPLELIKKVSRDTRR